MLLAIAFVCLSLPQKAVAQEVTSANIGTKITLSDDASKGWILYYHKHVTSNGLTVGPLYIMVEEWDNGLIWVGWACDGLTYWAIFKRNPHFNANCGYGWTVVAEGDGVEY